MAKSKAILSLSGYDEMLEEIARAGGKVDEAAEKALRSGAREIEKQLRAECSAYGVPESITADISTNIEIKNNVFSVGVGWELGEYDPNALSQGYKALFLNYGTPKRKKHGKVSARGFIALAKIRSRKNVKKAQEEAMNDILKGLKE